jgi:hypothetical protein
MQKIISVENSPGLAVGRIKENSRRYEFKYDILIHCKNLCNCHNVSPPRTITKGKKRKKSPHAMMNVILYVKRQRN